MMGFDYKFKYVPGDQIPHTDALSRLHFNEIQKEEKVCFNQNEIFFAETQTIKLNDIENDLKSNRFIQEVFKRIQNSD